MSADTFKELNRHFKHELEVVRYGKPYDILNVAIECRECNEVLLDYENEGE